MKRITLYIALLLVFGFTVNTNAQSRKEKNAAKAIKIKSLIDSGMFIFIANYVTPLQGGQRYLTSEYDVRFSRDSIITFLPYFGRAYLAPNDYNPTEGGIKFTTTNFTYNTTVKKNGTWEIRIKPKDNNIADWRDVQQLYLTVGTSGYATLDVISSNRDPISFNGYIDRQKPLPEQQKSK